MTFKGMLSIVIFGGTWLVPGFGWNITFVFFRLIVSRNWWAALAKELVILFMLLIECAMRAQSSTNSRSQTSSSVVLVLTFRCCIEYVSIGAKFNVNAIIIAESILNHDGKYN